MDQKPDNRRPKHDIVTPFPTSAIIVTFISNVFIPTEYLTGIFNRGIFKGIFNRVFVNLVGHVVFCIRLCKKQKTASSLCENKQTYGICFTKTSHVEAFAKTTMQRDFTCPTNDLLHTLVQRYWCRATTGFASVLKIGGVDENE